MKIRSGFVSNSSSISFVVLIPEDFDFSKVDKLKYISEYENGDENVSESELEECYKSLIEDGYIFENGNYGPFTVLLNILNDYVIVTLNSGPDDVQISLSDLSAVKKILKIE